MTILDFNDADRQRETGGLIPEGTIALAVMVVRPGQVGPGGWLSRNKAGDKEMLDAEFTLAGGKYERRKLWKALVVSPADSEAGRITRAQLRAALESARAVHAADDSAEAMAQRQARSYGDFDGLAVCIKVGVERGRDGYPDKNTLRAFVTPDDRDYINPGPQSAGAPPASAPKPAWAS